VFTARYALTPYIKQACFVFKGLNAEALQSKGEYAAAREICVVLGNLLNSSLIF
jgi:hypothetical protein